MTIAAATWIVNAGLAYAGVGIVFGIVFALRGAARIDPDAAGATTGFRILLVPGAAALWPLLLVRWMRAGPPPTERSPHRLAARAAEDPTERPA